MRSSGSTRLHLVTEMASSLVLGACIRAALIGRQHAGYTVQSLAHSIIQHEHCANTWKHVP